MTSEHKPVSTGKTSSPQTLLVERLAELRARLQGSDPLHLAACTGADYFPAGSAEVETALSDKSIPAKRKMTFHQGCFRLPFWNALVELTFPEWVARSVPAGDLLPPHSQALLLYYFSVSSSRAGSVPSAVPAPTDWISFADLPDGRFYNQAFQGYTGKELARAFGADLAAFEQAARRAGGLPLELGGASAFTFQSLPRLSLAVVYWPGDEDFPASCQVLFDPFAGLHLTTDGCAGLGSSLTRRLIALKK